MQPSVGYFTRLNKFLFVALITISGYLFSLQSAQATTLEIHIVNDCTYEAWSVSDGIVVYFGEPALNDSSTWSVSSGNTTVVYVDIGSENLGDISKIEINGETWADSSMTSGLACYGVEYYGSGVGSYATIHVQ